MWYNRIRITEYLKRGSMKENKCYLAIDLKSFYASVECVERGLDPMTTDLIVADPERTDKTICLAVKAIKQSMDEQMEKLSEINKE